MGYIVETNDAKRRNPIMSDESIVIPVTYLGSETTFGFVAATQIPETYMLQDAETTQSGNIKTAENDNFGVGSLATWKNSWVRSFCNKKNRSVLVQDELGYNFVNTLDFTSIQDQMTNMLAICYPNFRIEANDGFKPEYVTTKSSQALATGKIDFVIDPLYEKDEIKLEVKFKSDLYLYDDAIDYSDYTYSINATVGEGGGSSQPYY